MKKDGNKSIVLKVILTIFVFVLLVYIFGVVYFSKYVYPNTLINNIDMSFSTISSANDSVKFQNIEIIDRENNKHIISPEELGFTAEYAEKVEIEQNSFAWPIELFTNRNYENKIKKDINSVKLKNWINNSQLVRDAVDPEDAHIEKSEKGYYIEKEVLGTKLDIDKLYATIEKAYLDSNYIIKLKDEYINPTVYTDSLEARKKSLNKLFDLKLALKLNDGTEESVEDLEKFINEDNLEVEESKIIEYVKGLKEKYDNIGKRRLFKTSAGTEVEVPPGNFGVQINLNKTVESIYNSIKDGKGGVIDIVYTTQARDNGEVKDTYVEISIANQHMWFYKNGNLVIDTPIVTGLPGRYSTPKGVWNVWIKEQNRYLQGLNADGSKYKSWVNYWMQIDGTGVGIHDSSWQSSYGGNVYTYRGSHGCINTPLNIVKTIYDNIEKGTPVIV